MISYQLMCTDHVTVSVNFGVHYVSVGLLVSTQGENSVDQRRRNIHALLFLELPNKYCVHKERFCEKILKSWIV
jgi:hypothetical protein